MKQLLGALILAALVGAAFYVQYWKCSQMFPNAAMACMFSKI